MCVGTAVKLVLEILVLEEYSNVQITEPSNLFLWSTVYYWLLFNYEQLTAIELKGNLTPGPPVLWGAHIA